ncbi:MAG: hypothetical protein SV775_01095 [Thermodesulfobacteriota bacterium]|nr:hypothetical protein [Thermodesulfobacteriota bacterium]
MKKTYSIRSFFLLLSLALMAGYGCSTTKSLVQKIRPEKPVLKKRIMILPLIDLDGPGSERAAQANKGFVALLRKSPSLLLFEPPEGGAFSSAESYKFGIFTPANLVKKAYDASMNTLITGILEPIQTSTEKTGIWPFRKSCNIHEISIIINVVDTRSKALALSRLESEMISVPLDETPGENKGKTMDQLLEEAIDRIVKRLASAVISSLEQQPWTGRVLSVEDSALKINAGDDVGLKPGQRFMVYAGGESITTQNGRSFELLGKKIGKIEVTSIMEKHSLAVPAGKGPFLAGQTIRFIP